MKVIAHEIRASQIFSWHLFPVDHSFVALTDAFFLEGPRAGVYVMLGNGTIHLLLLWRNDPMWVFDDA